MEYQLLCPRGTLNEEDRFIEAFEFTFSIQNPNLGNTTQYYTIYLSSVS